MVKTESWKSGGDFPPAPIDAQIDNIKPLVTAPIVEIPRQRGSHPPNAATDVEHAMIRLQSALFDQDFEEHLADRGKIAGTDKDPVLGRTRNWGRRHVRAPCGDLGGKTPSPQEVQIPGVANMVNPDCPTRLSRHRCLP
jgi:hypothetical protein